MQKLWKRGDVNDQGLVFWQYKRGSEYWVAPEKIESMRAKAKESRKKATLSPDQLKAKKEYQQRWWQAAKSRVGFAEWNRARALKWSRSNKEKCSKSSRLWKQKNPEKVKIHNIQTRHKRRERIVISKNKATALDLVVIKNKAQGKCHYCGEKGKLWFDHVTPLAKGGSHSIDNIVMACKRCNLTKNAKMPEDFAATIGRLLI